MTVEQRKNIVEIAVKMVKPPEREIVSSAVLAASRSVGVVLSTIEYESLIEEVAEICGG